MRLRRFTFGGATPQLLSARAHELEAGALGFDVDVSWESEMVAHIDAVPKKPSSVTNLGTVPVSVRNVIFKGPVSGAEFKR